VATRKKERINKSAEDWKEAALEAFASGGIHAASIPEIARRLGVTKGSFYWHFRNLDEFLKASLQHWEVADREAMEALRSISDARERLIALFEDSMQRRQGQALFISLSGSAVTEVSASIRRISERRVQFLLEAFRELGVGPQEARDRALLAYTAYVGVLNLRKEIFPWLQTRADLKRYVDHAVEVLLPSIRRSGGRRRAEVHFVAPGR